METLKVPTFKLLLKREIVNVPQVQNLLLFAGTTRYRKRVDNFRYAKELFNQVGTKQFVTAKDTNHCSMALKSCKA